MQLLNANRRTNKLNYVQRNGLSLILENAFVGDPKERMKKRRPSGSVINSRRSISWKSCKRNNRNYSLVFRQESDVSKPMSEASINKVIKLLGYSRSVNGSRFQEAYHEHHLAWAWVWRVHGFEVRSLRMLIRTLFEVLIITQYIKDRQVMMEWCAKLIKYDPAIKSSMKQIWWVIWYCLFLATSEMPYSWLTIVIIIVKTNVAAKLSWMLGNKDL